MLINSYRGMKFCPVMPNILLGDKEPSFDILLTLILGSTVSGMTYADKQARLETLLKEGNVVVVDPEKEYEDLNFSLNKS